MRERKYKDESNLINKCRGHPDRSPDFEGLSELSLGFFVLESSAGEAKLAVEHMITSNFLAITKKAAVNICVKVFVQTQVLYSFGLSP